MPFENFADSAASDSGETTVIFQQAMVPVSLFAQGFTQSVYSGPVNPAVKEMYSIALIDISKGIRNMSLLKGVADPHSVGGSSIREGAEHFFSVPPKTVEVGEPYASKIVPTQNGGKYVESHGSILRDIRISGNSGLRPNKPLPASIDLLGGIPLGPLAGPVNSIAGPIINRGAAIAGSIGAVADAFGLTKTDRPLNPSERTGWDDIMWLRNIFRAYSDIKNTSGSPNIVMVWRDIRTADFWIVEPKEFKLIQDSNSPMTYNYQITMKTLARFEGITHTFSDDPLASLKAGARQVATVQKAMRTLTGSLVVLAGSVDRLAAVGVFAQNLLMEPIIDVLRGTSAVINSFQGIQPSVANNWKRLVDNADQALKTLDKQINPNIADPSGPNLVASSTQPLTVEEQDNADSFADIVNTIRDVQRAGRNVLIQPAIQQSLSNQVNNRQNRATNAFRKFIPGGPGGGSLPQTAGHPSFIGNQRTPGAVSKAVVQHGETIASIAQRLLGNRARWKVLVLINDLKSPYISTNGELQTLAPSDYIYYPVQGGGGLKTQELNPDNTESEQKGENPTSVIDRAYGRDIRLKSNAKNRTDLVVSADGDLSSIQGVANVKQGMRLKFSTEQGTLTVHPLYGASFPIGSKMTNMSFNLFRLNAYSTLISDPRISSVKNIQFFARGDTLSVGAELILKDRSDVTTTSFDIAS